MTTETPSSSAFAVETNGINTITPLERRGAPRDLFWPWCAANIAVLGISYGSVNAVAVGLMVVGAVVGWGLVTNSFASWLSWQGYLLEPFGLGGKDGAWAYANLGVLAALAIGFAGYLLLGARHVRAQVTV